MVPRFDLKGLVAERVMRLVKDGYIYIVGGTLGLVLLGALLYGFVSPVAGVPLYALAFINFLFMLYFFRDPERISPADDQLVVSGADGTVRSVEVLEDEKYLGFTAVRISVYLSPFNVHVNRLPLAGKVEKLAYIPGKHLLTASNASSEFNEHSSILITGEQIPCLIHQIVGPLVRRVVYWLSEGQELNKGDRLGIMKFGSRLDVYLPADKVAVVVSPGDNVEAGLTPIAKIKEIK